MVCCRVNAGKQDYFDQTGTLLFSTEFDRLDNFSDGLALVEKDNEYFYIDNTGTIKMRLGDNIDYAGNFFEGYASVKKGDMYGFIDKSGAVIVPFEYSS